MVAASSSKLFAAALTLMYIVLQMDSRLFTGQKLDDHGKSLSQLKYVRSEKHNFYIVFKLLCLSLVPTMQSKMEL